ncbi:MAG: ATP-binding cassette domain-containing protein [Methylophilaceae bacterium]|nr:ATP-binding cassette domain-containing protein [Methylophilaceae bacterium]
MIQFKNITIVRGIKVLIEGASLQLHPSHKVGLTGANGAGKSSLFAMLRGELEADKGDLEIPSSWVVGHVAQETPALSISALQFVLEGDEELSQIEQDLVVAEANAKGERIAELHGRLSEIEGYSAKSRAAGLLDGLGFSQVELENTVSSFSGGWRVRLNLARALMCRSDLLLLDEPTNHLDLEAVFWLENWLKSYQGTLLLISHDREFLDAIVNHITHIEHQTLTLYKGGYSDFERQRSEKLVLQQAMHEKQQRKVAHLHSYIDRFKAKATKAKQAQSRIKALERMELISAAHVDTQFNFSFRAPSSAPEPLMAISDVDVGYADKPILSNVSLTVRPKERIGLLGPNGAGKTTLIKLLAGELKSITGKRILGKDLNIGYFAQHQLEQLRAEESPLQHMQRQDSSATEQELLNYLGGFDFRGDMARSACEKFSGGEKSRLALALLIWTRPSLLLLDEPTNHLDLEMRHALTLALQAFEGGVILISHDRSLLRTTCDQFLLVANGVASIFDGDLDDYATWVAEQRTQAKAAAAIEAPVAEKKNSYAQNKLDRQTRSAARRPLIKESDKLERDIAAWQLEKATCDERLNDTTLYEGDDKTELQALLKLQSALTLSIEEAEERWLVVHEELEALPELNS